MSSFRAIICDYQSSVNFCPQGFLCIITLIKYSENEAFFVGAIFYALIFSQSKIQEKQS